MDQKPARVVVGVDGLPSSRAAISYAGVEAKRRGAELRLINVTPEMPPLPALRPILPASLEETGQGILRLSSTVATNAAPGLAVSTELVSGDRVQALLRAAESACLVVLGQGESRLPARIWTGHTSVGVAASAACPVTCVPSAWDPERPRHGRVVVGFKSVEQDGELLAAGFAEAAGRGAELVIQHSWYLPITYIDPIAAQVPRVEASEDFEAGIEVHLGDLRAAHPEVAVRIEALYGQPAHALVDASSQADLVLLSRRTHGLIPRWHVGGTARALLRESRCPVQVVASGDEADDGLDPLVLEEHGAKGW